MVYQYQRPPAIQQPGHKRPAVLGIDDHIRAHSAQRPKPTSGCGHRQQRP
ncbi:Uncharacterised protein [Mycobacterium tuberculosis]|nr:Uncharacterised protein [Mycobacterium tuberculosis]